MNANDPKISLKERFHLSQDPCFADLILIYQAMFAGGLVGQRHKSEWYTFPLPHVISPPWYSVTAPCADLAVCKRLTLWPLTLHRSVINGDITTSMMTCAILNCIWPWSSSLQEVIQVIRRAPRNAVGWWNLSLRRSKRSTCTPLLSAIRPTSMPYGCAGAIPERGSRPARKSNSSPNSCPLKLKGSKGRSREGGRGQGYPLAKPPLTRHMGSRSRQSTRIGTRWRLMLPLEAARAWPSRQLRRRNLWVGGGVDASSTRASSTRRTSRPCSTCSGTGVTFGLFPPMRHHATMCPSHTACRHVPSWLLPPITFFPFLCRPPPCLPAPLPACQPPSVPAPVPEGIKWSPYIPPSPKV